MSLMLMDLLVSTFFEKKEQAIKTIGKLAYF